MDGPDDPEDRAQRARLGRCRGAIHGDGRVWRRKTWLHKPLAHGYRKVRIHIALRECMAPYMWVVPFNICSFAGVHGGNRSDVAPPPETIWLLFALKSKAAPKNCSLHEHIHFAHRSRGCVVDPTPHPPTPLKQGQILRGSPSQQGSGRLRTSVEETLGLFYGNTDTTDTKCNKPTPL